MNLKKTAWVIVLVALVCAMGALAWRPALAGSKPTIAQVTPWTLNDVPCGTQAQCQQAAIAAAQASPGAVELVAGPAFAVSVPASGGSTGAPCPNDGAMQPQDYIAPDGSPVFADPCHQNQH